MLPVSNHWRPDSSSSANFAKPHTPPRIARLGRNSFSQPEEIKSLHNTPHTPLDPIGSHPIQGTISTHPLAAPALNIILAKLFSVNYSLSDHQLPTVIFTSPHERSLQTVPGRGIIPWAVLGKEKIYHQVSIHGFGWCLVGSIFLLRPPPTWRDDPRSLWLMHLYGITFWCANV